ncbi:MAG: gamma-glutamylcyclotransferase [Burkholderiaceae bacterium]
MTRGHLPGPGDVRWLFGYGSLIWRPDFPFLRSRRAVLPGHARRFWQGSHDHRGTPDAPGRVLTVVPQPGTQVVGIAFELDPRHLADTLARLDHREKNGYVRRQVKLDTGEQGGLSALTYLAEPGNAAWLGDLALEPLAAQIAASHGPSGRNADYLIELARALRAMDVQDEHVFALEARVDALLQARESG